MKQLKLLTVLVAYDNVLTPFIPDMYQAIDQVSRELTGFIPSVSRNVAAERAALNESIYVPVTRAMSSGNVSPAMTVPEPTDFTLDNVEMKITKSKQCNFGFTGEDTRTLNNGVGTNSIFADNLMQAMRTLANEIEVDLATEAYQNACRAYGTPTTALFGTNTGETAQLRKILDDNGAPATGRSLVLDTAAGAALRTLTQLTKVNEAGTSMTLRDGELLNLNGLSIKESAGIQYPAIGTAAATADIDTTGYAVGSTTIGLASAGSGTILAGDYVTFAGDTNKYLVTSGDADVSGGGSITIAKPGLRVAISTSSGQAVTVVGRSYRNIGFAQSALQLIARAPALPNGRDAAIDSYMLVDPRSGLPFEIRVYEGYRKMRAEVALAWGVKAIKPEHIAALIA